MTRSFRDARSGASCVFVFAPRSLALARLFKLPRRSLFWRDEAGPVLVVARFPHGDDLIQSNVANAAIAIFQAKHTAVDGEHFAAHVCHAQTSDVNLLADELR